MVLLEQAEGQSVSKKEYREEKSRFATKTKMSQNPTKTDIALENRNEM